MDADLTATIDDAEEAALLSVTNEALEGHLDGCFAESESYRALDSVQSTVDFVHATIGLCSSGKGGSNSAEDRAREECRTITSGEKYCLSLILVEGNVDLFRAILLSNGECVQTNPVAGRCQFSTRSIVKVRVGI